MFRLFSKSYQRWYTQASEVVRALVPHRLAEFRGLYESDPKRKQLTSLNFSIQDWQLGRRSGAGHSGGKFFEDAAAAITRFRAQTEILASAGTLFDSSLLNIRGLLQAELLDSEIEAARELLKKGFLRAGGILAGVAIEKHLAQVCTNRQIPFKKDPTISDLNERLKAADAIDIPTWRFVQRLSDLRNICGHNKGREPTNDEVRELIDGVDKMLKSLV